MKESITNINISIIFMKKQSFKHLLYVGFVCAGSLLTVTSCVDSDYDFDKVDLTMGLGGDGLSVKLGNTERIMLSEILDVDETVKLDGNNLYYLVKDGHTDFGFRVNQVTSDVKKTTINNSRIALNFSDVSDQLQEAGVASPVGGSEVTVPAGFCALGKADGIDHVNVNVTVPHDIRQITHINLEHKYLALTVHLKNEHGMNFSIDRIKDFEFVVPEFMKIAAVSDGWTVEGQTLKLRGEKKIDSSRGEFCKVMIADLNLEGSTIDKTTDELLLTEEMTGVSVKGDVYFRAEQDFLMQQDEFVDVYFDLETVDGSDLRVESITCRIDPEINPGVERIEVGDELPDFLKDNEVQVNVANPTIKLIPQMAQMPVGVEIGGTLTSDTYTGTVTLPKVEIDEGYTTTLYYYGGDKPYDPAGAQPEGTDPANNAMVKYRQVNNVSKLVEKLPEAITIDMQHDQITVQDKLYVLQTNHEYNATAEYYMYVPFEFNKGFTIVYNDSTTSMNDDFEDYGAEGLRVSATIINTIPLDLTAGMVAVDENGNSVPGIHFSQADIPASVDGTTEVKADVTIDATLDDPYLLKKVDRFKVKVKSVANQEGKTHKLYSTQYLEVKDIKVRLTGKVIADFN